MNPSRPDILIVDDEPANIEMLAAVLREDYEIYVATNGDQCLHRATSGVPLKLILLDVVMPGKDGFEVCRALKRDPATRDVPVIFITAKDSEEYEAEGLRAGAVDFISKPFRPSILAARVRTQILLQEQKLRLQENESLLKATLQSTKDGILVIDDRGRIALYNQRFTALWRIPAEAAPEDDDALLRQVRSQLEDPRAFAPVRCGEDCDRDGRAPTLQCRDGRVFTQFCQPLAQVGSISGRVWSFTEVTEQRRLEAELRRLTITDGLTGLYNRRHMMAVLADEWERRSRYGDQLGLLMCDVDHFKRVNDDHGHAAGDRVLQAVAGLMGERFRHIDTCCRYGGEEFCAIMPRSTTAGLREAAERFRAAVAAREVDGVRVTISIGIASSAHLAVADTPEQLIKQADEMLYRAKAEGRDRVCG